jgi:hypothetical protein
MSRFKIIYIMISKRILATKKLPFSDFLQFLENFRMIFCLQKYTIFIMV